MTESKSARNTIKETYSSQYLQDIVDFGCTAGFAEEHFSYAQTEKFFDTHTDEITKFIIESIGEVFISEVKENSKGDLKKFKQGLVWTFIELIAMDLLDKKEDVKDLKEATYSPPDFKELFTETYLERFEDDNDANYYMLVNISSVVDGYDPIEDGLENIFNTSKEEFKEEILDSHWSEEDFEDFGIEDEFADYKALADQVEWDKVWESIQYSCDEETLKKLIAYDHDVDIKEVNFTKLFPSNSKGQRK